MLQQFALNAIADGVFARTRLQRVRLLHQTKINAPTIQIDPTDLHANTRSQGIPQTRAFATKLLAGLVKTVILPTQLRDVDKTLNVHRIQCHEDAETRDSADNTRILFTEVFTHVFALEPGLNVPAGFIGTALIGAAMHASSLPGLHVYAQLARFLTRLSHAGRQIFLESLGQFGMRLTRCRQVRQDIFGLAEYGFDDTVDQQVYCLLDPATQRVYNGVADDLRAKLDAGTITASNALTRVLRLAQIANGFATDDLGQLVPLGTEKADLLGEVLADLAPQEPVVVFGRFVEDLASIARVAQAQGRAYHEVSGRRNDLAAWQDGEGNVLGVQLQAGGVGVDLTRARYQVYLSLDFSLGNYLQTRKRIHRPGQTRNVTYIHLLAAGTVDETILTALQQRRDVVTAIVDGLGQQVKAA